MPGGGGASTPCEPRWHLTPGTARSESSPHQHPPRQARIKTRCRTRGAPSRHPPCLLPPRAPCLPPQARDGKRGGILPRLGGWKAGGWKGKSPPVFFHGRAEARPSPWRAQREGRASARPYGWETSGELQKTASRARGRGWGKLKRAALPAAGTSLAFVGPAKEAVGRAADGGGGYSRPKRRKSFEVSPVAMPSMEMEVPETVTAASVASRHVPESRSSVT